MSLGLQTESGDGDFADVVKYDARAGRWFRVDRSQDSAGNWSTNPVDVTAGFQAVFDLANVEVGWVLFATGVAPSWSMVPLGQALPPKPSDQHKQAFRLQVLLGKTSGGDVREFASQAKVVINALDALHTAYAEAPEASQGLLPVVSMPRSEPVVSKGKGQQSTNYAPVLEITAWVKRPDRLGGEGQMANNPPPAPPPPAPAEAKREPVPAGAEF